MAFTQDEWDSLKANYPAGTRVIGVVVSCQLFGVFVRLDQLPEVKALLEIIHFAGVEVDPDDHHRIEFPANYPPVGTRLALNQAWSEARIA